jgi:hypothetical protein
MRRTKSITPGYFDTLRVPLLAGRDFTGPTSTNAVLS